MTLFKTPQDFAEAVMEARMNLDPPDRGTVTKLIEEMGIAPGTFYKYYNQPKFRKMADGGEAKRKKRLIKKHKQKQIENDNLAQEVITNSYKLHLKGMQKAIRKANQLEAAGESGEAYWEKARKISREALQVAKTEAKIKQVFVNIGELTVDNRQVNIVNEMKEWTDEDKEYFFEMFRKEVCPKCPYRRGEVIDVDSD